MTPAERVRLAEALTTATGQPWRVGGFLGATCGDWEVFCGCHGDAAIFRVAPPTGIAATIAGLDLGRHEGPEWADSLAATAARALVLLVPETTS